MWALIMTINFNSYMKIVTVLDNFQTEQQCRYAGASQEVVLRQDLDIKTKGCYTFICVKKGE